MPKRVIRPMMPCGHGERLAVARAVGPGHGDLLALQVLQAAEVLLQPGQVGQGLGRVVDVALEVDDAGPAVQHALLGAVVRASPTSRM